MLRLSLQLQGPSSMMTVTLSLLISRYKSEPSVLLTSMPSNMKHFYCHTELYLKRRVLIMTLVTMKKLKLHKLWSKMLKILHMCKTTLNNILMFWTNYLLRLQILLILCSKERSNITSRYQMTIKKVDGRRKSKRRRSKVSKRYQSFPTNNAS